MNPTKRSENFYTLLTTQLNIAFEDFKVLGQVQAGNKLGLTEDKHFTISGGSTQFFIGDLYQRAYRGYYKETLDPSMKELREKITNLNFKLDYCQNHCKDMLTSLDLGQIYEFKEQLQLDLAILKYALEGLKILAVTYRAIEENADRVDISEIDRNYQSIPTLIQKVTNILSKLDPELIYIPEGEEIIEELNKRIIVQPQDDEGIFREGGSEVKIKLLLLKIEEKKEIISFDLEDTPELTSVLKRLIKDKIIIIKQDLKSDYLRVADLTTPEEKVIALREVFSKIPIEKKKFIHKFFHLCENIYSRKVIKMDQSNLTVSLSMNFIQQSAEKQEIIQDVKKANSVFGFLLTHYFEILN